MVDEVGAVEVVVDLLPAVGQLVVQALLQRALLELGEPRVEPVRRPGVVAAIHNRLVFGFFINYFSLFQTETKYCNIYLVASANVNYIMLINDVLALK